MENTHISINISEDLNNELELNISINSRVFRTTKDVDNFYTLHRSLIHKGYATLSEPPPFELFQTNRDHFKKALEELQIYFKNIFYRQDVKYDPIFLEFCGLTDYYRNRPSKYQLVTSLPASEYMLGVSDIVIIPNLLIISFEDQTNLSKFGCMWSIFEPDVRGAIQLYTFDYFVTSSLTKLEDHIFEYKVKKLAITGNHENLIAGRGDGSIDIYHFTTEWKLVRVTVINAHCEPLLLLSLHNEKIYTTAYDSTLRISNLNGEIDKGGNMGNRLRGQKIVAGAMTSEYIVFGTSANGVLIYAVQDDELPKYLCSPQIGSQSPIHTIIASGAYVFVSHGYTITCMLITKTTAQKCALLSDPESPAFSLVAKVTEKLLYSGHENKISLWCLKEGRILYSWYTDTGKLRTLRLFDDFSILCAGDVTGECKMWELPTTEEFA